MSVSVPRSSPLASARLTIDRAALAANYRIFCDLAAPGCRVAGVIKADGYGLGVDQVLATLENQGCPFYYVATPDEALHLRSLTRKPVAVLGGIYPGAEDEFIHHNLIPVLNTPEDLTRWREQAHTHEIPLPAILHLDTGMNRLGLSAEESAALQPDEFEGLNILYVMSHFTSADNAASPATKRQFDEFSARTDALPAFKKSLCNSAGAFRNPAYHGDQIRPGMALYGLNPTPETDNPMQPVVRLSARILQVRSVKKGQTIGYNETYSFDKNTRTATVALGYADGFLRSLSSGAAPCGHLYYNGIACPVIGRVSMDAVTVDLTPLASLPVQGDMIEVIGPHQDADALASAAGTIGYEILTDLGRRYHRDYL
ncbi:MAG: alanine racemase [Rhodospirillales bacterium]|nr:alanine racemase [Rhodospirillales bacterium]MCB9997160.1 alanine racemase [Rhodospirillales bacterium]